MSELDGQLEAEAGAEAARRLRQAAPPEQLFAGLYRYWRNRGHLTAPLQRT